MLMVAWRFDTGVDAAQRRIRLQPALMRDSAFAADTLRYVLPPPAIASHAAAAPRHLLLRHCLLTPLMLPMMLRC